jgi:hypothetical protein
MSTATESLAEVDREQRDSCATSGREKAFRGGDRLRCTALLYNPAVPAFTFTGDWPRTVVAVRGVPFAASLSSVGSKNAVLHHG